MDKADIKFNGEYKAIFVITIIPLDLCLLVTSDHDKLNAAGITKDNFVL